MASVDDLAEAFLRRLDSLKTNLALTAGLPANVRTQQSREARAAAIVYTMAELESLLRQCIQLINDQMNQLSIRVCDLQPCLRALALHSEFDSLVFTRDADLHWSRRAYITNIAIQPDIAKFPVVLTSAPQPPLDGRTITPKHIGRIWTVYGLKGTPFIEVSWQQTLTKLSGLRNDLVHSTVPFGEVWQSAGVSDQQVERYLNEMQALAVTIHSELENYVAAAKYLA